MSQFLTRFQTILATHRTGGDARVETIYWMHRVAAWLQGHSDRTTDSDRWAVQLDRCAAALEAGKPIDERTLHRWIAWAATMVGAPDAPIDGTGGNYATILKNAKAVFDQLKRRKPAPRKPASRQKVAS